MTNICKNRGLKRQTGYLVPIVTILLSSALLMGVGYAGVASSVDVFGNPVESTGIVLVLTDDDGTSLGGTSPDAKNFSSGINSISYSKIGSSYQIFKGERLLGGSKLIIDATQSKADKVVISASVKYKLDAGNTIIDGLPYDMIPKFVFTYLDSEGDTVVAYSGDEISITPEVINTLTVEFFGVLEDTYSDATEPDSFTYQVMFEATAS